MLQVYNCSLNALHKDDNDDDDDDDDRWIISGDQVLCSAAYYMRGHNMLLPACHPPSA
jgi:hypothetical protein